MSKPRIFTTMVGAAGDEVTGSCTLIRIECDNKVYHGMTDCGVVQGGDESRNFNFPVNAENLDFVMVTHAHADHFLMLPLLRGFKGKVYSTSEVFTYGRELLDDGANLYAQIAATTFGVSSGTYKAMLTELEKLKTRKNANELQRYQELLASTDEINSYALFSHEDVGEIAKHFHIVRPFENVKLFENVHMRFVPGTHQDGSGNVELYVGDYTENSVGVSFSGDIGPKDSFLYKPHNYIPNHMIQHCVMESLHGVEERTESPEEAYQNLKKLISKNVKKDNTIILVGFALDRIAKLVYAINRMRKETGLNVPVYLDTPLGYRQLIHYQNSYMSKDNCWFKDLGENPFDIRDIKVTNAYSKHVKAVTDKNAKVVITASAFGEGGRVIDYFDHYIQDDKAVFIFAGWISPECTSTVLCDAKEGKIVEIHGKNYVKHCKTIKISGFSSHGYMPEYLEYIERFPSLKSITLNHAKKDVKCELATKLQEFVTADIHIPETYDSEEHAFYCMTCDECKEITSMEGYDLFKDVLI